jgi:hypothetical protein
LQFLIYSALFLLQHPHDLYNPSRYHPNIVDETKLSCSKAIYTAFECSRQNYMWQKVLSRARLKDWAALKDLSIDRGIFLTTTGACVPIQCADRHTGRLTTAHTRSPTSQKAASDSDPLLKRV